jgi:CBS-domain-containing membrane protein
MAAPAPAQHSQSLTIEKELPMQVENLMSKEVQCVAPEDSLAYAAQLMWDHDCGCLPVCSPKDGAERRTIGVLTDRDVCMNALFEGKPLRDLRVSAAMTKEVHACQPSDTLAQAERVMRNARVRRIPVLGNGQTLIGMISLADLACQAAREHGGTSQEITETEIGDTLAAICERPSQPLHA